jgi:hypothetical protein
MQITVTYGKGFEPKPAMLPELLKGTDLSTLVVTTERIDALTSAILEMPQAEIVTTHTFLPGVYERKITLPPSCVLTGAPHKTDYKVRLEKGTIAVNIGDKVVTLVGPLEFDAKAGEQRVGWVMSEEVVWVDIYDNPDDCRDLEVLENQLYVVPECGLLDNRLKLMASKKAVLALQGEA